jgi:hypothetical protein
MMGEDEFERLALPSKSDMPPLTRQTTYSSLPPSPRYDEYDIGTEKVNEFEEALGRLAKGGLRRSSVSASAVPRSFSVDDMRTAGVRKAVEKEEDEGMSMWDLLKDEVGVEDWDGWIVDGKWERIANFLAVPLAVEKVHPPPYHLRFINSRLGDIIRITTLPRRLLVQFHHPPYPLHLRHRPNSFKRNRSKTNPPNPTNSPLIDTTHVTPLHPYRDLAGSYGC